jgi:hypothetical protein
MRSLEAFGIHRIIRIYRRVSFVPVPWIFWVLGSTGVRFSIDQTARRMAKIKKLNLDADIIVIFTSTTVVLPKNAFKNVVKTKSNPKFMAMLHITEIFNDTLRLTLDLIS